MKKRVIRKRKTSSKNSVLRSRSKSQAYKEKIKAIAVALKEQRKRTWRWVVIIAILFLLALVLIVIFNSISLSGKVISNQNVISGQSIITGNVAQSGTWDNIWGSRPFLVGAFSYIFGAPLQYTGISDVSAAIITIAVWLLIFFTFADIIRTFSTFSKVVSWVVGFLIAVVAANFGWIVVFLGWTTAIFAVLGSVAVYVGLGAAFAAFIGVNLGLGALAKWALKRQAGILAIRAEAGGKKLQGALSGLGEIEKALEKIGEK